MTTDLRKWLAFGTGVGIEVREHGLQVTVSRVRPSETRVLGSATVTDFHNRPAAEWGSELGEFLKQLGAAHIAATVLLPRHDVIVRQILLPGVTNRDLGAAVQLQVDSLHPFTDEDVYYTQARAGKTSSVLVGIARRKVVDRYTEMFAEAGLKVASFTFSAAVLFSAIRLITPPPEAGVLALHESGDEIEVYGESEARPVYSAQLSMMRERAIALAASELRLDPATEPRPISDLLPKPSVFPANHDPSTGDLETNALAYATSLAGACPWLSIEGNLLPQTQRRTSSRARLIPTIGLASVLFLLIGGLAAHSSYSDSRYFDVLQHQINRLEPQARRSDAIDREIATARQRAQTIDDFRRRPKIDMDTIGEVTKLIAEPGFLSSFDLDRDTIALFGEVEQAAVLLKSFDESRYFERSEFIQPITRGSVGELFRMRTRRQTPPGPLPVTAPANAASGAAK